MPNDRTASDVEAGYKPCSRSSRNRNIQRAATEIGFIVFLFYSNLLMGEYTHSAPGRCRGLLWALNDTFTAKDFLIAAIAAVIGYLVAESLRERL